MAAPRSSTAATKPARTRRSPTQSAGSSTTLARPAKKTAPEHVAKAATDPASAAAAGDLAAMLEDLRTGGEALTAQIARLAHRFL